MSYITPNIPVPSQDSADNNYIQDVIGNKTDTHNGNSLYANIETQLDHIHSPCKVYPTLADGVTVTTSGSVWVLGAFAEIVPASTITSDFDIHHIGVESIGSNSVFELVLYKGALASEIEIGRVRFAKNSNFDAIVNQPFQTEILAANERISAKVADDNALDASVVISIFYHTY